MKQKKLYMKINNTRFLLSSLVMCTLFCGSILGLYSCSIAPTLSKFPVSDIRLGVNKVDVKKQCGFPFRSDVFTRNHKRIDVLCYNESFTFDTSRFLIIQNVYSLMVSCKNIRPKWKTTLFFHI